MHSFLDFVSCREADSLASKVCNPGRVLPYKRLMGMCRWMGSHFQDWIDYNGVAFSIELLEWGRTYSDFLGKTVLHISSQQTYQNVCTVGVFHSI